MATDTATSNSMGITNHATGSFTGDGATTTVTLGFTPRVIRVVNATDRITDEYFEGLAASNVIHTVAAGTRTLDTGGHITIGTTFNGFTIHADAAINAKLIVWEAFG